MAVSIEAQQHTQPAPLTERQEGRLKAFAHLTDRIFSYQRALDAGGKPTMKLYTHSTKSWMGGMEEHFEEVSVTQRTVDIWMNTALDMVNGFKANPILYTAVVRLLKEKGQELREEREARQKSLEVGQPATEQEMAKLNTIFDAGNDDPI